MKEKLEKFTALLEYLLDPTKEKDTAFCISCDKLASSQNNFSPHRAMVDVLTKEALKDRKTREWQALQEVITEEIPELEELFFKAASKYNIAVLTP